MYQVKFEHPQTGETAYGIHSRYHPEAEKYKARGQAIVELALDGKLVVVPEESLTEIKIEIGRFNRESDQFEGGDEFHQYIQEEHRKAQELSDSLPEGVVKGKLFAVGVADGSAYYVVTKVNRKTVDIEWRGFCMDRWTDRGLGYGGRFQKDFIERYVGFTDGMKRFRETARKRG